MEMSLSVPLVRLTVTLVVLATLVAARRVPLPGLDYKLIEAEGLDPGLFSIALLGPMTWITSFLFVELGALTRDRWRALRIGGPEGRARLEKAARVVWVFVAAAQAFAIALSLEQIQSLSGTDLVINPGWAFRSLAMATMMAGSALVWLGARSIDRWGFGNGFAVLAGLMMAETALPGLELRALFHEGHSASVAPVVFGLLAVVYGAWRLPTLWTRDGTMPLLAAGLAPVAVAISWPTIPGILGFELPTAAITAATVAIAAGGALLYGTLFHLPWNVAPVVGVTEAQAADTLRRTMPLSATVAIAAALVPGSGWTGPVVFDVVALAVISAHGWDLHAEWRARAELGDVEVAWPLHRVYAVPPALRALEGAGIPARVRGLRFRQLLFFFGPHVPIELLVPRGRVAEAQDVLRAALLGRGSPPVVTNGLLTPGAATAPTAPSG